jgi:hypothetical protein
MIILETDPPTLQKICCGTILLSMCFAATITPRLSEEIHLQNVFNLLGTGLVAVGRFRLRNLPDAEKLTRLANNEFIVDDLALCSELRPGRDPIDHVAG